MELTMEEKKKSNVVCRLYLGVSGELMFNSKKKAQPVSCKPSFPWSSPLDHISVMNEEGEVLLQISSLQDCEESEKNLILRNLEDHGFLFDIVRVEKIEEEFELRHWEVETKQGKRSFQTALEKWPRTLSDGSFLIEDVFGDLYRLENVAAANSTVLSELEALVY